MPNDDTDTDQDFGDEYDYDGGASWCCNHDVLDGCSPCRQDRAWNAAFEAMTDDERAVFLYGPTGRSEDFFAPGGLAFQQGL